MYYVLGMSQLYYRTEKLAKTYNDFLLEWNSSTVRFMSTTEEREEVANRLLVAKNLLDTVQKPYYIWDDNCQSFMSNMINLGDFVDGLEKKYRHPECPFLYLRPRR